LVSLFLASPILALLVEVWQHQLPPIAATLVITTPVAKRNTRTQN
jgi:hypothetical protein